MGVLSLQSCQARLHWLSVCAVPVPVPVALRSLGMGPANAPVAGKATCYVNAEAHKHLLTQSQFYFRKVHNCTAAVVIKMSSLTRNPH